MAMIKTLVARIITVFLIVIFVWYFYAHIDGFKILLSLNIVYIIPLVLVYVAGFIVNGLFMKWSIALFGKEIKFGESVKVSLISTAGNFFAPAGTGLAIRAVYLKQRHNLAYSNYSSIVLCNYILTFLITATLGLWAVAVLWGRNPQVSMILSAFFITLLALSTASLFLRVNEKNEKRTNKLAKPVVHVLARISNGWQLILSNKRAMVGFLSLTIINIILLTMTTFLVMGSIGVHMSIASLILVSVIGCLSIFINITPGNLGIKESIYILFSTVIGLSTTQILSAALIEGVVLVSVIFLLWLIYGRKVQTN